MRTTETAIVMAGLAALTACPHRTPADPANIAQDSVYDMQTEPVGVFHKLKAGETMWSIARRYGVQVDELIEINGIANPRDLRAGRLIFVPDVDALAPEPADISRDEAKAEPTQVVAKSAAASGSSWLSWPLAQGVLYSGFGTRRGVPHDGIDLGAPQGTEVLAAADGEVIYVGEDRAFGHLVIVRHPSDWVTVYAHNHDVVARLGQKVKRGQVVAHVGQSGRSQGPHVHFELRKGHKPVDPLPHLPEE